MAQVADECVPSAGQAFPCVLGARQPRICRLDLEPLGSAGILHLSPSSLTLSLGCPCVLPACLGPDRRLGDAVRGEAGVPVVEKLLIRAGECRRLLLSWRAVRAFWL